MEINEKRLYKESKLNSELNERLIKVKEQCLQLEDQINLQNLQIQSLKEENYQLKKQDQKIQQEMVFQERDILMNYSYQQELETQKVTEELKKKMMDIKLLRSNINQLQEQNEQLKTQKTLLTNQIINVKEENQLMKQKLEFTSEQLNLVSQQLHQKEVSLLSTLIEKESIIYNLSRRFQELSQLQKIDYQQIELDNFSDNDTERLDAQFNEQIKQLLDDSQQKVIQLKEQLSQKEERISKLQQDLTQWQQLNQQKIVKEQILSQMPEVLQQKIQQIEEQRIIFNQIFGQICNLKEQMITIANNNETAFREIESLKKKQESIIFTSKQLERENQQIKEENLGIIKKLEQLFIERKTYKDELIKLKALNEVKMDYQAYEAKSQEEGFESFEQILQLYFKLRSQVMSQSCQSFINIISS